MSLSAESRRDIEEIRLCHTAMRLLLIETPVGNLHSKRIASPRACGYATSSE